MTGAYRVRTVALALSPGSVQAAGPLVQTPQHACSKEEDGAPGGIRTPDLLIRSQLLYPLSYGRTFVLKESTRLGSAS